jgi:hypothetical protein
MAYNGYLPSGSSGIEVSYGMSYTGLTLTADEAGTCYGASGGGWIGSVGSLGTSSGYTLQGDVKLADLAQLSATTYSQLTGGITIYYTGLVWELQVKVNQNSETYTYSFPTGIGTTVAGCGLFTPHTRLTPMVSESNSSIPKRASSSTLAVLFPMERPTHGASKGVAH